MIYKRIAARLRAQDGLAITIELAIVVVGVFLGTQVSNWNQSRLNRAEGHEYRLRLMNDLRANQSDLRDRRIYYTTVRNHAREALAALERPAGAGDAGFLIDAYEASQITPRKMKRFTYDEILSRGAMTWIGDARFRERIANYYVGVETTSVTFDGITPYRELIRQSMPAAAQGAVRRDCPERVYFTPEGAGQAQLSQNCKVLRLSPATIASAAATVRVVPGLSRELTRQIADLDVKLGLIGPMVEHQSELLGQIAAANAQ